MTIIDIQKDCVGCGACVDTCPDSCLSLIQNENGFYEPRFIEEDRCIGCEKCIKVCPAVNRTNKKQLAEFYYGWNKDDNIRKNSSSGGVFSLLSQKIINDGGVVFGAKYSKDYRSVLMSSTEECNLDELRRSKYCQSYSNKLFFRVAENLEKGKKVMVVGTPCQISAARKMFKNNENLFLVDFLCGGVTPQTAFNDYIDYMENKYKSRIKYINMRDKKYGWNKPSICIEFENGKIYRSLYQFDYYYYYYCTPFLKNKPCLACAFTQHEDADMTIADFWGYDNAKVVNDNRGISLLAIYTTKGKKMLESIKSDSFLFPLEFKFVEYAYKEKYHKKYILKKREMFLKTTREKSFIKAAKSDYFKYGKIGVMLKIIIYKVRHRWF